MKKINKKITNPKSLKPSKIDFFEYQIQNQQKSFAKLSFGVLLTILSSITPKKYKLFILSNMKTNKLFVGLVLSCIVLLSFAQNCCITNSIRVQGQGENNIKPNIALLYASLSANGATASAALSNIDDQLNSIANALPLNGVSASDVATSSISVYPQYNYTNGTSVIIGYTVYLSLTVTIRGIDTNSQKIASIIDVLANAGVTSIYGLTYETADPNAGKAVARNNAWNDAVSRAKQYAQLSGRKLGSVLIIEEVSVSYYPYYYSVGTTTGDPLSSSPSSFGSSPSLPIGNILVTVIVTVTWSLS